MKRFWTAFGLSLMMVAVFAACYSSAGGASTPKKIDEPTLPASRPFAKARLEKEGGLAGLWVMQEGDPKSAAFAAVYADNRDRMKAAVIGVAADQTGGGFDFAVIANEKKQVYFQIRDEKGQLHFLPVSALLKLKDK